MKAVHERVMYAGLGAQSFLDRHEEAFPSLRHATSRSQLVDALPRLAEHSREQARLRLELAGQFKRQKWLERRLRREHLVPVALYARACVRQNPSYKSLAISVAHVKGQALVDTAYAMARTAKPFLPDLMKISFPRDTIDQISAAADELQATIRLRQELKNQRVQATAGITTESGRVVDALRKLSAVMEGLLERDAPLMAAWRRARGLSRLS